MPNTGVGVICSTHTCTWLWQRTRSIRGPSHAEPLKVCQSRLSFESTCQEQLLIRMCHNFARLQPACSASAKLQNHFSPAPVSIFTESYPLSVGKNMIRPRLDILPLMLHVGLRACWRPPMLRPSHRDARLDKLPMHSNIELKRRDLYSTTL